MAKRKLIQISSSESAMYPACSTHRVYGLCDDGTLWRYSHDKNTWALLTSPPVDVVAQAQQAIRLDDDDDGN